MNQRISLQNNINKYRNKLTEDIRYNIESFAEILFSLFIKDTRI